MEEYVVGIVLDSMERNYYERIRMENLRDRANPFTMSETKFMKLFRLSKLGALRLITTLNDPLLDRGYIPKHIKILSALQFFAQGSYQTAVGQDSMISMSQPAISMCLKIVSNSIVNELTPHYVRFPITPAEKESAKADFQHLFNLPNTLGAVDGTHVAIAKPPLSHPTTPGNLFYNRKGFYSINCQIVCNARGKIIALNPNFPGSTHDAAIWRSSQVYNFLRNEFVVGERDQWLLGDKGYPLQPWLMTPVMEPMSAAEMAYNESHAKARNVVEMCNGRLKNKFRCLHRHRCLHYQPEKAAKIILSCCTLYNMFSDTFLDGDEVSLVEPEPDIILIEDEHNIDFLAEARMIRQSFINTHFR